jgi:hypothetical protein
MSWMPIVRFVSWFMLFLSAFFNFIHTMKIVEAFRKKGTAQISEVIWYITWFIFSVSLGSIIYLR